MGIPLTSRTSQDAGVLPDRFGIDDNRLSELGW